MSPQTIELLQNFVNWNDIINLIIGPFYAIFWRTNMELNGYKVPGPLTFFLRWTIPSHMIAVSVLCYGMKRLQKESPHE